MEASFDDLIQEITQECKDKSIEASRDLIAFLISLVSLSSACQVDDYEEESGNESKILAGVIEKLRDQSGPSIVTLKLQFHFAKYYRNGEHIVKKHRCRLAHKTSPLVKEICEVTVLDNAREIEKLYQKMLVVITLLSGLGNPTIPAVLREVAIALQSVLQPSELPRYVTLSRQEKEEQLMELVFIVAGIRLFNRDCQRGGEGIDDCIEAAIQSHFYNDCEDGPEFKDIMWTIEMLVATRQQEIYVSETGYNLKYKYSPLSHRKLLSDLEICEEKIRSSINRLQFRIHQLHETVKYRTAVPTAQVYPQFVELAEIWLKLQDEVIVLSYINDMLWQLENLFPQELNERQKCVIRRMTRDVEILTDAERLEKTMGKLIVECGDCSLTYPGSDNNFDKLNLQFLGFCAWSFVVGKGALIPGNPNIGVAEYRGKFYAFKSVDAARDFGNEPDRFISIALDIVRERPEYVHLFQIYNDIQTMNRQERLSGEYVSVDLRHDQEIQTETHPIPTLIDKDYSSNLWVHKNRALHLASICQCKTQSTQTNKSYFRHGAASQTIQLRDKQIQTGKDSSTNTHVLRKYIFGLRGREAHIQIFDWTFNK